MDTDVSARAPEPLTDAQPATELRFVSGSELQLITGSLSDDPSLDGSEGVYRSGKLQYIDADNDLEAIRSFLSLYSHSPNTLRTYEKECLRYCLWARLIALKAISSLNADDVYAYERFIRQPPKTWCRPRVNKSHPDYKPFALRFKNGTLNPNWRPFQGALSDASVKVALSALKSLHAYLHDARYTDGNPFKLHRGQRSDTSQASSDIKHKALTDRQWALLQRTIDALPDRSDQQRMRQLRAHFIMSVFYYLGLRINEAVNVTMGDFYRDRQEKWWLTVLGKGSKTRDIPVPADMLRLLQDYRIVVLDTTPLPHKKEDAPLIGAIHTGSRLTANRVYKIVKALFLKTAAQLDDSTPEDAADKQFFQTSTTHWLRHTYATNLIEKGATVRTAQLNLGHSSVDTTMVYSHKDDAKRHTETEVLSETQSDTESTAVTRTP